MGYGGISEKRRKLVRGMEMVCEGREKELSFVNCFVYIVYMYVYIRYVYIIYMFRLYSIYIIYLCLCTYKFWGFYS